MKNFFIALLTMGLFNTASAFQFRDFNFKQIDCLGSNGVTYKITDSPTSPIQIDTAFGSMKKTFYGNFFVTATNELNILMGEDKSGYIEDFHLYLPLPPVKSGSQASYGTVTQVYLSTEVPVGSLTCRVQYQSHR